MCRFSKRFKIEYNIHSKNILELYNCTRFSIKNIYNKQINTLIHIINKHIMVNFGKGYICIKIFSNIR